MFLNKANNPTDNSRCQEGRVMVLLKDGSMSDDQLYMVAMLYGTIKGMHRPKTNQSMVFIQYNNHGSAITAAQQLRNYPFIYKADLAKKADRYCQDDQNQQRQSEAVDEHNDRRSNKDSRQNARNKGDKRTDDRAGDPTSNGVLDRSSCSVESDGPDSQYQPEFSLGCWHCTKMPGFECQCGAFYCDSNCQRADWAKHRAHCMPRLLPISYSNRRILQEATASKTAAASADVSQQKKRFDQETNTFRDNQPNEQPQHQQQQQKKFQQNKNNHNKLKNNQHNKSFQSNASFEGGNNQSKQEQQQQQARFDRNASFTGNGPRNQATDDSCRVSQVGDKLRRLKLAKSSSNTGGGGHQQDGKLRILEPGPFPREKSRVKITASLSSGVVYICHNNEKLGQQSDYQQLASKVYTASQNADFLQNVPREDDVVFAPFLGEYYRGKVLAVKEDKIQVQFVDFGNSDTVPWRKSKEIVDPEVKWSKYLAFPVMLEGVPRLIPELKRVLDDLEGSAEFELASVAPLPNTMVKEVVLKYPKKSLTLNMELMELVEKENRQRLQREEQQERERKEQERRAQEEADKQLQGLRAPNPANYRPVMFDDGFETVTLEPDTQRRFLIIDASEIEETRIISVIPVDQAEQYAKVLDHCERVGPQDTNVYRPVADGEVCLVLHGRDWSRALYDKSDDKFMILDVGTITAVPEANVRRFPDGLERAVYNSEVVVENVDMLLNLMTDDKPESLHGKSIDAWISVPEDIPSIRVLSAK